MITYLRYLLFVCHFLMFINPSFGSREKRVEQSSSMFTTQEKSRVTLPEIDKSLFEQIQSSKKIDPKVLRPSITFQSLKSDNEDYNSYNKILDQQINELRKLIQKTKSNNAKGELLLRLAELYVEKADLTKMIIEQKYDQEVAKLRSKNSQVPLPEIDYSPAQGFNKNAIQIYERFVTEYPSDPRLDQALFFLGYNYFELGDSKRGLNYYQRLSKEFPKSAYIVESRFALGEYYFENNDFKTALTQYQFVAQSKNKKLATFANYKAAWCLFKIGDYKSAIIGLEKIIKSSNGTKKGQVELRLDGEARRDLILFYVEAGDASKAPRYFIDLLGETEGLNYLEKLAYVYADRGDRDSARQIFSYLINQKPIHPKSFDYQYQVVRLYSTAKDTEIFKYEMWSWIKKFGPKSAWFNHNKDNKELTDRALALLEQTLRIWILQQHQTAQNSRGEFSQKMAMSGYQLYFAEFPNSAYAVEMHFFYGELLYDMKRYDEASKEYRWVVENGGSSKYRNQAAANILVSAEKSIPSDAEITKKVGERLDPVPLGSAIENYMIQANWFLTNFPNDKKVAETQFRIGRLYYQHNHFDKAIPYFRTVVKDHSNTKYAEYAANLLLDIYNLKHDYEGLSQISKELLAVPGIAKSAAGKEIHDVLQKANFKKVQDLDSKGNFVTSAQQYEKFIQEYPNTELGSMAYFNAAVNYHKAGVPGKSVKLLETLSTRKDAKAIELRPQVILFLATLYRDIGQLEKAAAAYVQAAHETKDQKDQSNQYYNAAVLYEALDERSKAIANYMKYYDLSKSRDKSSVLHKIAEQYRKSNQRSKSIEFYTRYLNEVSGVTPLAVESAYWIYWMNEVKSERDKWALVTFRHYGQLPDDQKPLAAKYPAKIEIDRLKALYSELWSIKLNDLKRLQELSNRKIAVIESINQKAAQVVKLNSPEEILEAVKIVGDSNLNLYDSLVNSPIPPELTSPEKIKEYKETVRTKLADPFFIKAIEAYQLVVQRSSEFEVYSEFSKQARQQLVKLKPGILYETGQIALDVQNADWMGL